MYNLFIGRWSPFHEGHKYIIDSFAKNGKKVCIGIRDTKMSVKDPFPAELRKKLIDEYYKDNDNVISIVIPDIDNVCVGRDVGYSIMEVPEQIKKVSGTEQRKIEAKNWNGGKGKVFWFTGLPCSGKTTLIKEFTKKIKEDFVILDGDTFRKEVTTNLGFSKEDRLKNIEIAATIANTLKKHGIVVFCAFVSPFENIRETAKQIVGEGFKLIHIKNTPEECALRDVKGMWKKAREGIIKDFTGYNAPYEIPLNPDLVIDTNKEKELCLKKLKEFYEKE